MFLVQGKGGAVAWSIEEESCETSSVEVTSNTGVGEARKRSLTGHGLPRRERIDQGFQTV